MTSSGFKTAALTSIRIKLAFSLFAAVALFLGLDHAMRLYRFGGAFEEFERTRGEQKTARIVQVLTGQQNELAQAAEALGSFDDAKKSLIAGQAEFDLVVELDTERNVRDVAALDPRTREAIDVHEFQRVQLMPRHPVIETWLKKKIVPVGAMDTRRGPLLLGSHGFGAPDGGRLLVLGRFLNKERVALAALDAGATFEVLDIMESIPPEVSTELTIAGAGATALYQAEEDSVHAYRQLISLRQGLPLAMLRTPVERHERMILAERDQFELLSSLGIAILFPLALLILIQWIVTGPLASLTEHAALIGASDDDGLRLNLRRKDEIGILATEFDRMLDELERSRLEQKRTARFAGRADIAAGIMHSVGNLANSVTVSANLAKERADEIDVADLEAVHGELERHRDSLDMYVRTDPKGKHLLPFLGSLTERMAKQVQAARAENDNVMAISQQISDMILALNQGESPAEDVEWVSIDRELADVAVRVRELGATGEAFPGIVQTHLAPGVKSRMDRQMFMEIVEALTFNAIEAMAALPPVEQVLDVHMEILEDGFAEIRVEDTGVGIEPDQLEEIFSQGHSSKANHVGLGLHKAANAAKNLGGSLHAESEGLGSGARFVLLVPVNAESGALQGA